MPRIFVSYRHGDENERDEAIKILNSLSYDSFYDEDIRGGEAWRKTIESELEGAKACVVVVTDNIFESKWVLFEVGFAIGFGIEVIPWCPKPVEPSKRATGEQLYDLLHEIQFVETEKELADKLKEANENHIAEYLNIEIHWMTLRFRVLAHTGCAYLTKSNLKSESEQNELLQSAQKCFEELSDIWVKLDWKSFWLENSSSFNRKQKRIYNKLIDLFSELRPKLGNVQDRLRDIENGYGNISKLQNANNELVKSLAELDTYIDNNIHIHPHYRGFLGRLTDFTEDKHKNYIPIISLNLGLQGYDKKFIPPKLTIWFDPKSFPFNSNILNFLYKFRIGMQILCAYIEYGDLLDISGSEVYSISKKSLDTVGIQNFEDIILKYSSVLRSPQQDNLEFLGAMINRFRWDEFWMVQLVFEEENPLTGLKFTANFRDLKKKFEEIDSYIERYFGEDSSQYKEFLREIERFKARLDESELEKANNVFGYLLRKVEND
jgi:hypothetical protein